MRFLAFVAALALTTAPVTPAAAQDSAAATVGAPRR